MDKLDIIFKKQKEFDDKVAKERNLTHSKEEWVQKFCLAIIDEVGELLNETNYKWWKNPKEINDDDLKEEIIDILHFVVGMSIKAGMDADELFEVYQKKNKENFARQAGLSDKKGYEILK